MKSFGRNEGQARYLGSEFRQKLVSLGLPSGETRLCQVCLYGAVRAGWLLQTHHACIDGISDNEDATRLLVRSGCVHARRTRRLQGHANNGEPNCATSRAPRRASRALPYKGGQGG